MDSGLIVLFLLGVVVGVAASTLVFIVLGFREAHRQAERMRETYGIGMMRAPPP